jgi:peptidoglycan/LPS O-acetylase OafA/YrhL
MNVQIKSASLDHPKYRADIDGLRAIAVLSVVGFHAFPGWVRGGFIGVDIFFVISGFLISTIIIGSLKRNAFSFIEFYSRRIKRIFPALALVLLACFTFGWFALLADEYKQLGKHIAGGAGFLSNFILWKESGYFDNAADTKPLLHLWSLGIEEQFYIVWPLLLFVAWKSRLNLPAIIVVLAVISAALNIRDVQGDIVAAFYSPQTRFWELLAGSILAYITLDRKNDVSGRKFEEPVSTAGAPAREPLGIALRDLQSVFAAALIAAGLFLITREDKFPGWWAMLPVGGTVLIISAGPQAWLNRTILSQRVVVWFGLISYPLYLWHWPLLSFTRIVEAELPSRETRIGIILLSVLLAWLTYRFIEKPFRFARHTIPKTFFLLALMVAVGGAGYTSYARDGLGFRLKDREEYSEYFENSLPLEKYFARINLMENYRGICDFYDSDKYRRGQATTVPRSDIGRACYERDHSYDHAVFIWGDSHGAQLYSGLKNNLPPDWQILQVTGSGCHPLIATGPSKTAHCIQSNWFALQAIEQAIPDVVIVAQANGHNLAIASELTMKLKELGVRKIIFTGPTPQWTANLPRIIAAKLWINTPERTYIGVDRDVLEYDKKLKAGFAASSRSVYADLIDALCNSKGCLTYLGSDKKTGITSWDEGHLTPVASDYVAKNLLVPLIIENAK